ncbi:MAG: tRNA (adenosine(37)-N6)-threonylcarbamoyltransferase complex ATPase subunit type 1 TsaE [Cyanophyceae cyanobacterium]
MSQNFPRIWRSHLSSFDATIALGRKLGQALQPGAVILLSGDLGAGKTTLVKAIAEGLGISDPVNSPTFVLVNEYFDGRSPLYHFDLYRLEPAGVAGVDPEMYWEGMEVEPGIVAIEWAERLPYLPGDRLEIRLNHSAPPDVVIENPLSGRDICIQQFGAVPGWDIADFSEYF